MAPEQFLDEWMCWISDVTCLANAALAGHHFWYEGIIRQGNPQYFRSWRYGYFSVSNRNRIMYDCSESVINYLLEVSSDFEKNLTASPPANYGSLAPVGYTGFRWATQIDPIWNVYFLALVIEIGGKIEAARIPVEENIIFSYRFNDVAGDSNLFKKEFGWKAFCERAISLAEDYEYVVSCDISEFYPRLNHHRLENALRQLPNSDASRIHIMEFLKNFSETYSFGLPVGGPASRILSELTLNQIDRLLNQKRIKFCRFADDFYMFSKTHEESFKNLVFLSQILQRNQGLQLQKSKTRIMKSAEFLATNPMAMDSEIDGEEPFFADARRRLFKMSLHFDPYSQTAAEDYARLKEELEHFPILDLIKSELGKSRINISLSRKLIQTLKFISESEINETVITLIDNSDMLYPIFFNVLSAIRSEVDRLNPETKRAISHRLITMIEGGSPVMAVDLNVQYAVRLLGEIQSEEATSALVDLFDKSSSDAIKRDIILIMTNWRNWVWLSDRKAFFRQMTPSQRRAYIIASYSLTDEGRHWREHTKDEFSQFENIVKSWISNRVSRADWKVPL